MILSFCMCACFFLSNPFAFVVVLSYNFSALIFYYLSINLHVYTCMRVGVCVHVRARVVCERVCMHAYDTCLACLSRIG